MLTPPYEYEDRPAAYLEAVYAPVANPFKRDLNLHKALRDDFGLTLETNQIAYEAFFDSGPTEKYAELVRLANASTTPPNLAFLRALASLWTLSVLTENALALPVGNA
jgi:hypothetical protein